MPYVSDWAQHTGWVQENLGICYVGAALRVAGFDVQIRDLNMEDARPRIGLSAQVDAFDLIGFSVFLTNHGQTSRAIKQLRDGGFRGHITLGGQYATLNWRELLSLGDPPDSVVCGEGEETAVDLARALARGDEWRGIHGIAHSRHDRPQENPPRPLVEDLDGLARPDRTGYADVLRETQNAIVVSSRGCTNNCLFCSIRTFYRGSPGSQWRARSAEAFADELEHLHREYGVTHFAIHDDNFLNRHCKERVQRLIRLIEERSMEISFSIACSPEMVDRDLLAALRGVGLRTVGLGVESFVERQLRLYRKATTVERNHAAIETVRDLDIGVALFAIFFDPFVTLGELTQNFTAAREVGPELVVWLSNTLMAFRGTEVADELRKRGVVVHDELQQLDNRFDTPVVRQYRFADPRVEAIFDHVSSWERRNSQVELATMRSLTGQGVPWEEVHGFFLRSRRSMLQTFEEAVEAASRAESIDALESELQGLRETHVFRFDQDIRRIRPPSSNPRGNE